MTSTLSTSKFRNLTATELIQQFGVSVTASVISIPRHPFHVVVYGHIVARYSNMACATDTANNEIDKAVDEIHKSNLPLTHRTVREQATDAVRVVDHTGGLKRVYKLSLHREWLLNLMESDLKTK